MYMVLLDTLGKTRAVAMVEAARARRKLAIGDMMVSVVLLMGRGCRCVVVFDLWIVEGLLAQRRLICCLSDLPVSSWGPNL